MKVELFAICDAATDYNGRLNMLGIIDSIWAEKVPAVHPQCAVAVRLRFQKIEEGMHTVRTSMVNADGSAVVKPVEAEVNVQFQAAVGSAASNMILNLHGIRFAEFGEYSIDLAVDSRHEASLPLYIREVVKPSVN